MKLTNTERLMLVNQFKILAKLNEEDEESAYYSKKAEILERGYEWYYDELLSSEPLPREVSNETMDILDMFRQLDAYVDQLSPEQKANLDLEKLKFDGFDATNDKHYGFAKFIIEKDDRYNERKEMYLNSHTPTSIQKYRRMLPIYKERKTSRHLTFDDLIAIQNVV